VCVKLETFPKNLLVHQLAIVVGTRPNFVKVTRFKPLSEAYGIAVTLIHTGQHHDHDMAGVFLDQFGLVPDHFLGIAPSNAAARLGDTISALGALWTESRPDMVMAVGDVDAALACALAADKLGIPLVHLESGLRSFDLGMPEERNRIITDRLASLLLITEASGMVHLANEGIGQERMRFVGNTMIDTLVAFEPRVNESSIADVLGIRSVPFGLATFHRPALVDEADGLLFLRDLLAAITSHGRVVLPLHPRTRERLQTAGLLGGLESDPAIVVTPPLGYFDFQHLIKHSKWVVTDSGGIQEETTFRGVPCLTMRPNTERPVTLTDGTNTLVDRDLDQIDTLLKHINDGVYKTGAIPELWDGHATERCLEAIAAWLSQTHPPRPRV